MQFFYDVSELAQHDHQTGIQRVVRSVLALFPAGNEENHPRMLSWLVRTDGLVCVMCRGR
jgi:hypothetical protein